MRAATRLGASRLVWQSMASLWRATSNPPHRKATNKGPTRGLFGWLRFLNTYRTMCITPEPDFRRILEEVRELELAA